MIRITSKKEGFRRAGIAHPAAPTEYADDLFTPDQLELLKAEQMLLVEQIEDQGVIKSPPLEKMKVDELKELLTKLGIEIPEGATKAIMIDLVKANTAEPPKE